MDSSDWTVTSSIASSVAAIAAWRAVALTRKMWRQSREPDLHITPIYHMIERRHVIHVENAGTGFARDVQFLVACDGNVAMGALPPLAALRGGERTVLTAEMSTTPESPVYAVVTCRDKTGRYLLAWTANGRHRRWRVGNRWPFPPRSSNDAYNKLCPSGPSIDDLTIVTYKTDAALSGTA